MIEKEYLDYMQACYKQIWDYIRSNDNSVDHDKMGLFWEKSVTPYKFWLDEHKSAEVVNTPALLEALKKKYFLEPTKNGLKSAKYLGKDDFKKLAGKMRECGYEYENGEFVKKEVAAHV